MQKNQWRRVHIITTGGTIEKTYDEQDGTLFNRETIIHKRLNQKIRLPYTELKVSALMAKDSLDMNQSDREVIRDKIQELLPDGHPIVILHGTDTMQHTAELVAETIKDPKVAIVFTGAMKPLGFEDSDALQNVTEALMACQIIDSGTFICFHNRLYTVPGVRKNREKGTFEQF
ncbi:MAG: asparaginase domain-containing protein [Bdellovibrionota bacterium]|nr:asparaginase domain-containing protein [Bdellovibrionota bacterium]